MSVMIANLEKLNRKERFFLVEAALDNPVENVPGIWLAKTND